MKQPATMDLNRATEALERSVRDLRRALWQIELNTSSKEASDLHSATALKRVRTTMRSQACGLLMASTDVRQADDFTRVVSALRIVEPKIYGTMPHHKRPAGQEERRAAADRPKRRQGVA